MLINKDLMNCENSYSTSTKNSYSCNFLNGETIFYTAEGVTVYPVTCTQNISNFKHIEITYGAPRTTHGGIYTMRFDVQMAITIGIGLFCISGSSAKDRNYLHYGQYRIDGKNITFIQGEKYPQFQIMYDTGAITYTESSVKIFKVVGYKY